MNYNHRRSLSSSSDDSSTSSSSSSSSSSQEVEFNWAPFHYYATIIQRTFRGYRVRRDIRRQSCAALIITRAFRTVIQCKHARKVANRLKCRRSYVMYHRHRRHEFLVMTRAAVVVQKAWRKHRLKARSSLSIMLDHVSTPEKSTNEGNTVGDAVERLVTLRAELEKVYEILAQVGIDVCNDEGDSTNLTPPYRRRLGRTPLPADVDSPLPPARTPLNQPKKYRTPQTAAARRQLSSLLRLCEQSENHGDHNTQNGTSTLAHDQVPPSPQPSPLFASQYDYHQHSQHHQSAPTQPLVAFQQISPMLQYVLAPMPVVGGHPTYTYHSSAPNSPHPSTTKAGQHSPQPQDASTHQSKSKSIEDESFEYPSPPANARPYRTPSPQRDDFEEDVEAAAEVRRTPTKIVTVEPDLPLHVHWARRLAKSLPSTPAAHGDATVSHKRTQSS